MSRKLRQIKRQLCGIQEDLECLVDLVAGLPTAIIAELRKPVSLETVLGTPHDRSNQNFSNGGITMSKKCAVSLVKKSNSKKMAARGTMAVDSQAIISDNQDNTATILGVDSTGAPVDLSTAATLSVSSDNTAALTVDSPIGTTFAFHGVAPGSANINITATFNDGSIGPFSLVLPATVTTGPATGIQVTLGVPTSR